MKKKIALLLALLFALAAMPVASADVLDPFGRPNPNRPRPPQVAPEVRPPSVEIISQPAPEPDGDHALMVRFVIPDPGTCKYTLFDEETDQAVWAGEKTTEKENGLILEARYVYPHAPAGETAHYVLVTDFSLCRREQTSFGLKRKGEPETVQLVHEISVRCDCDGPTVAVSEVR